MRNFENYEVDENEYIEIHDTYCDEWSLDTYEENDFEVDCEEVEIEDTYKAVSYTHLTLPTNSRV